MKKFFLRIKTKVVTLARQLISLHASPHQIATGFAVGVFIGIFPTFGLGFIIVFAIAAFWKFNVSAAIIGTIIGNPLLQPFWIVATCFITGISPGTLKAPKESLVNILAYYGELGLRYIMGNFVVSIAVAGISYFIVKFAVKRYLRGKSCGNDTAPRSN
jgi:uncharacterized protein (DUF2062 family)